MAQGEPMVALQEFGEISEFQMFMWNGLIFKCWQQIQIKKLNKMQQKTVCVCPKKPACEAGAIPSLLVAVSVCCFKNPYT